MRLERQRVGGLDQAGVRLRVVTRSLPVRRTASGAGPARGLVSAIAPSDTRPSVARPSGAKTGARAGLVTALPSPPGHGGSPARTAAQLRLDGRLEILGRQLFSLGGQARRLFLGRDVLQAEDVLVGRDEVENLLVRGSGSGARDSDLTRSCSIRPSSIVSSAISRSATTGFLSLSRSMVSSSPRLRLRARWAASRTSSKRLGTFWTQSSTVTRAMRSASGH